MHKTKNEMFLILECFDLNSDSIKKICKEWEDRILYYANFGREYRDNINYLKYNTFLIILYKDQNGTVDNNFKFDTEKSLEICRKIFLSCDSDGKVKDDEVSIIPFYFSPVEKIDTDKTNELERKLKSLLPKDRDKEILAICEKKELTDEDMNKMCGWLMENENN